MKVIKKINNNVAICLDNNNNELIAFGKGIGFKQVPYELMDLSQIDRTFYGVDGSLIGLIDQIPEKIFHVSSRIVSMARNYLNCELNNNLIFTLADHINFAVERNKKGIHIKPPLLNDIQYFYEKERDMGELAVRMVKNELGVSLPDDESANIALHLINAEVVVQSIENNDNTVVINDIVKLVEDELDIVVDKNNFNYSRFVSHLEYLLKRKDKGIAVFSDNVRMYANMQREFPHIYQCVLRIYHYIASNLKWVLSEEELFYLMLHVNRVYVGEDCHL